MLPTKGSTGASGTTVSSSGFGEVVMRTALFRGPGPTVDPSDHSVESQNAIAR